ncbi:MAG TPA: hypothetical protein VN865_14230 [Candidatus Acidoferrales bacterium]|nr:hypothetical protein [Candidatus Acidoferrales bacterium]
MADDADAIYAEIERRKQRAKELGVPQLVWGFFETVKYLPSWASDDRPNDKKFVPPFVTEIKALPEGGLAFSYEGVGYSLAWSEKSNDSYDSYRSRMASYNGRLALNVAEDRVFELTLFGTQDQSSDEYVPMEWTIRNVEAFVEGPWVERITELAVRITQHRREVHEADARKRREDPAKLKDLKDRFGIK